MDEKRDPKPIINFPELLERARELWPRRPDLNPRTMREDAILEIVCTLLDSTQFNFQDGLRKLADRLDQMAAERAALEDLMSVRVQRAMKLLEPYATGHTTKIDPGYGFQLVERVYRILKGDIDGEEAS